MSKFNTLIPLAARCTLAYTASYNLGLNKLSNQPRLSHASFRNAVSSAGPAVSNKFRALPIVLCTLGTMAVMGVKLYKEDLPPHLHAKDSKTAHMSPDSFRMADRLFKHGLREKVITPDGNCQFRALADQIMHDQNRHPEVRSKIIDWLSKNERYSVDENNGAYLGDFLDREQYPSWETYCKYMAGNRAWGDHLTLVAATEALQVNLWILSSVDVGNAVENAAVDQYITTLTPRIAKPTRTARLGHYHEQHYTSLYSIVDSDFVSEGKMAEPA